MKTSTQLKALIRNLAEEKSIQTEIVLRNFMLERLLERISFSKYRNKFILKGGMLIAAMVGIDARSTMDMDATIKGIKLTEGELEKALKEILDVPIDDGVVMNLKKFEHTGDKSEYSGIRVSIEAKLDRTKQTMKVDITTGDIITPREVEYSFKLLLEDRSISILAYNLETILAEKLETILTRGTATTRMRDYYDIYILTTLWEKDIQWELFCLAFKRTAEKRGSYKRARKSGIEVLNDIQDSRMLVNLWNRYQQKNSYALELSWEKALESLKNVFERAGL
ncbi:MAG: nucleotidyl transferase AbiEii/AbiGii toxin family protein [Clostridiales bacterium]|nr:nucleotidyl transferase AbiEii/AbiGii toxin family protein [Clostridiales bacterium]